MSGNEIERIRLLARMSHSVYQHERERRRALEKQDAIDKALLESEKRELEALQRQQAELEPDKQSESLELLRREILALRTELKQKPKPPKRPDEKEIIAASMRRQPLPVLPPAGPERKYSLNQLQSELGQWSDNFFQGDQQKRPPQRKSGKNFHYFGGS